MLAPNTKRQREAAASAYDDTHNSSPLKLSAPMHAVSAADLFSGGGAATRIPLTATKHAKSAPYAAQPIAPVADLALNAEQELLVLHQLRNAWADVAGSFLVPLDNKQLEQDVALLRPMVLQVYRNPISCMCGALGLPIDHPYSKELVLLDLAVIKAKACQMQNVYAQIVLQRNAYAQQASETPPSPPPPAHHPPPPVSAAPPQAPSRRLRCRRHHRCRRHRIRQNS